MNDIQKGLELSKRLSERLTIPLVYTTISAHLKRDANDFANIYKVMFIQRYMKLPWEG